MGFMFLAQNENLLPKRLAVGVALKTLASNIKLSRFQGFRKLFKYSHISTPTKLSVGGLLVLYFLGYQPVLAIPPIKKDVAWAAFSEEQSINKASFGQSFSVPFAGYITTRFSSWHPGIDIAAGLSTPIHPIANGRVVEVTLGLWGLGHYVVIEHPQGIRSTYSHMGRVFARVGDSVSTESIIGEVGLTGHTTGPHTHLEVTLNGHYIDPETILPNLPDWPMAVNQSIPQGQREISTEPTSQNTLEPDPEEKITPSANNKPNLKRELKFTL